MSPDEANDCVAELRNLFPQGDLQIPEQQVFMAGIMPHEHGDVISVLREHRLSNDYSRPKFGVIMSKLTQRRAEAQPSGRTVEQPTHGQLLARTMDCPPDEAVVRFWRGAWVRYAKDSNAGLRGVPDGGTRDELLRNRASKLSRCRGKCKADLIAEGVALATADAWADFITAYKGDFQTALGELRVSGGMDRAPADPVQDAGELVPMFGDIRVLLETPTAHQQRLALAAAELGSPVQQTEENAHV